MTQQGQPLLPIVINLSYGLTAGPHDGTSLIEGDIETLVANVATGPTGNLTFVLPAGNAQLSRGHARVCWNGNARDPQQNPAVLPWRVLPNDLTVNQLEIWLPNREKAAGDRVRITVTPPGGAESDQLGETDGEAVVLYDTDGVTAIAVASYSLVGPPTNRGQFLISLRPTEHLRPTPPICGNEPDAPAGVWEVRIYQGKAYNGEDVETWIQRNDTPFGYPIRGRQSYFDESAYVRYDPVSGRPVEEDPATSVCHVKRVSLINAIATSCSPVVVGGVFRDAPVSVEYSAGGPRGPTAPMVGKEWVLTCPPSAIIPTSTAVFSVPAPGADRRSRFRARACRRLRSHVWPQVWRRQREPEKSGGTMLWPWPRLMRPHTPGSGRPSSLRGRAKVASSSTATGRNGSIKGWHQRPRSAELLADGNSASGHYSGADFLEAALSF